GRLARVPSALDGASTARSRAGWPGCAPTAAGFRPAGFPPGSQYPSARRSPRTSSAREPARTPTGRPCPAASGKGIAPSAVDSSCGASTRRGIDEMAVKVGDLESELIDAVCERVRDRLSEREAAVVETFVRQYYHWV